MCPEVDTGDPNEGHCYNEGVGAEVRGISSILFTACELCDFLRQQGGIPVWEDFLNLCLSGPHPSFNVSF